MVDPEEVTEIHRADGTEGQSHPTDEYPSTRVEGNLRRNPKNSSGVGDSGGTSSSGQSGGNSKMNENGELGRQTAGGEKEGLELPQEDLRARFYEHYRKEAEEYDKDFMKKYDEDLNTTLIFAGLFSAVTSAFIIEVHSEFQQDPNEETAALLRVLIHKIDNTSFGGEVPTIPQWSGPTNTVVQVQAILLASLTVSLFSAFLAMLGKQWLNRYASIDMRGSAVQRSQNRQRKLDGVVVWYFDHVMESLPLMLQVALLLLGCALSRYLWEINTTVASVVLGVTSFGILFYLFIVVAGAASASCPYQTPGAHLLRGIPDALHHILDISHRLLDIIRRLPDVPRWLLHITGVLRSVFSVSIKESVCCRMLTEAWDGFKESPHSLGSITKLLLRILHLPIWLVIDAYRLGRAIFRGSVGFVRGACSQLWQGLEQRTDVLDMHCALWALRTSLDGPVRASVLNYLATVAPAEPDPTLVVDCFDILLGCVKTTDYHVVITQGLEQLARGSALCFLQTFSHLAAIDPTSRILDGVRQRYTTTFPFGTDFDGPPFSHTLGVIHNVFYPTRLVQKNPSTAWESAQWPVPRWRVRWEDCKSTNNEHIVLACALSKLAQFEYQRRQREKLPRWLLHFALHFLSQDPLPPTSVIADCLSIIAIDLDCTLPNATTLDESARLEGVSHLIAQKLSMIVRADDQQLLHDKRKAISSLFPYVLWQDRVGQEDMFDTLLRAVMTSNSEQFIWHCVKPYIPRLSNELSPPSLNQVIVLASPHVSWHNLPHIEPIRSSSEWPRPIRLNLLRSEPVARWAAAVSAVPYTDMVGQSVVDALLQIASVRSLRPHIPVGIWSWLKKRPSLPPECSGRSMGTSGDVVRHVRALGDIEVLKSYLLLVWSEWDPISSVPEGLAEMQIAIREDFSGIGMGHHRGDLIERLDHVLGQFDRGLGHFKEHKPRIHDGNIQWTKGQYGELKEVLLEVERQAMGVLAQSHSTFTCALPLPCP